MNITIIKNKNILDYKNWEIWECAPSQFDWTYNDEEHCLAILIPVFVEPTKLIKSTLLFSHISLPILKLLELIK